MAPPLPVARHGKLELYLVPALANRHGLITGATGTGKTVSLQVKDLRALLEYVGHHAHDVQTQYGNVSAASIGAIQRGILALQQRGADQFIGSLLGGRR